MRRYNIITWINEINSQYKVKRSSFMETFSLKQRINKFGQEGYKATYDEMIQLHKMIYFNTIKVAGFNPRDSKRSL